MRRVRTYLRKGAVWCRAAMLICGFWGAVATASADEVFSEERPLFYEDAWDLWPYVYLNEKGEPEGYNIDLLKLICKEMDIPYAIKLKPTAEALKDLKSGRADLMMGMAANFHDEYAHYSKTVIQLFTHSVVYRKNTPLNVRRVSDLRNNRVIVHAGSFSHHYMEDRGWGKNAVPYDDMKEAIYIASRDEGLPIVWNTLSLKWLIHTFDMDNLNMAPIDILPGEYRFMSNNEKLLAKIDSTYTVLRARGMIEPLQNKWFYPERVDTGVPSWVWYLAAALALLLLIFFVYYVLLQLKERNMIRLIKKANNRLSVILQTSGVQIFTYDVSTGGVDVIGSDGRPFKHYSRGEFRSYLPEEDALALKEFVNKVVNGEADNITFDIHSRLGSPFATREFAVALSVLRRNRNGSPAVLIGTRSDMTDIHSRQLRARDNMQRYQAVFNTPIVDMIYFNADGMIEDINEKACATFGASVQELKEGKVSLYDIFGLDKQWFDSLEFFHATTKMRDLYYEIQLVPVHDSDGRRIGFYGTGLNVTDVVEAYREQRRSVSQMEQANAKVRDYIDSINYALKTGGVRVTTYSPSTHLVQIFTETGRAQHSLTQNRCLRLCDRSSRNTAARLFDNMDECSKRAMETEVLTVLRRKDGLPLHLQFHFVPCSDSSGRVTSYFGICRDISELKASEQRLLDETQKMQDVESVKKAFLRNMSYEIRTPLTSVVGFSELFQMDHEPEEEAVFIEQIKNNSRNLLNLVNNILFLSRLDARMIEIKRKPVDFATVFENLCVAAWEDHEQPGVSYIVENPYIHLVADIDEVNLGIVIGQVVANAAQHTSAGSVRTRYDYTGSALSITVEDTGTGISDAKLSNIFDRFVTTSASSAGLGLSICHELVTMMGGSINIKSKPQRGTIVWIAIPCQVSEIERKP